MLAVLLWAASWISRVAHTSLRATFSLFLSELPAQILSEDGSPYTFLEGQKASLECETFGSPKPKVVW